MVDISEYIHEREPEAELMIHETWSFESGYGIFTNETVRDEIGADISGLYDSCAIECAAAIGQAEPLRFISSMDAFGAARNYTNTESVDVFNTTYHQAGHVFNAEDRATVDVGNGSGMLSPEDLAAGKTSLHRDGYHSSAAGRYLIALNAYRTLSGRTVSGNTFRPGEISLDSRAYYKNEGTGTIATGGGLYE